MDEAIRHQLSRLDAMVTLADSKAMSVLSLVFATAGITGTAAPARFAQQPPFGGSPVELDPSGWYLVFALAALASATWSLSCVVAVLSPRVRPRPVGVGLRNPLFFGTTAQMTYEEFVHALRNSPPGVDYTAEQVFQLSWIVDRKFFWVRRALWALYTCLASAVTTGLLLFQP